ncbi:DUF4440 domain-containing protein [Salmonirosea aquatica]|uniref:DUF4440 domain-containing protein n=1 Tax=Salmonirosea aquatica TaxID=2654236 RepID=A0A7C9FZE5_9BACT|nr:DUF4440 domain-containing protein [Cytophagaceae bacterium SJW1-29]
MKESIEKLMRAYERAFDALDAQAQAALFGDSFIVAGPKGIVTHSKDEFVEFASKAGEFYRSIGKKSTKVLTMKEEPISHEYSRVEVHWGVTFEKTGDEPVEFDISYIVQDTGGEPKIIMFITHTDEQEKMEELGLL